MGSLSGPLAGVPRKIRFPISPSIALSAAPADSKRSRPAPSRGERRSQFRAAPLSQHPARNGWVGLGFALLVALAITSPAGAQIVTHVSADPSWSASTTAAGDKASPQLQALEESDLSPRSVNRPRPAPAIPSAAQSRRTNGDVIYIVRPGDTLGAIADNFHVSLAELVRHNRASADGRLVSGTSLRIPNPFSAQVHDLGEQLTGLQTRQAALQAQLQGTRQHQQELINQLQLLSAERQSLQHEVEVLPWWRRLTAVALGAVVLMLGITGLALLEWFRMRAWFSALARANERLRALDERYRNLVAKAELRFQQLYGRRRISSDNGASRPEEFEVERLNRELKQIIDDQLMQLGIAPEASPRRSRLREWLVGTQSPAVIRSGRR